MSGSYMIIDDEMIEFMDYMEEFQPTFPPNRRYLRDVTNPLENYNEEEFQLKFRFTKSVFHSKLMGLLDKLPVSSDNRGLPIPPLLQMCVALRFFATGVLQEACRDLGNMHQATACRTINKMAKIIATYLPKYINFPNDVKKMASNVEYFKRISGFPGVIGCIDCTQIPIKSPGGDSAEVFRNRKGLMSINVQVVGGPQFKIQDIVIRWPGSVHESTIFDCSTVKSRLDDGSLQGLLLGDADYVQSEYLFTPLLDPSSEAEIRYNGAHKETWVTVQQLFGVWKKRFACLSRKLSNELGNSLTIIAACAVLHNIGRDDRIPEIEAGATEIHSEIIEPSASGLVNSRSATIRNEFIVRHF